MASNQGESAVSAVAASSPEEPTATEAKGEFSEAETPEANATAADEKVKKLEELKAKWPGWPGYTVFRLVVPVLKVGGIIGRKGDLIKKLMEETRARVRVLDGPITSPDRIVLISGKEDPESALPPAVDATIRIFRRVNELPENDGDSDASWSAFCLIRLVVPSTQAISLIGKQGSMIKSIQESSGASVRVTSSDDVSIYGSPDERVVEFQGEAIKVLKALEAVVGHLRKFLVDQSVLPLFEKSYKAPPQPPAQERPVDFWSEKPFLRDTPPSSLGAEYHPQMRRDPYYLDHESRMEPHIPSSRLSLYRREHELGGHYSGGPLVTQVVQTMQIPLAYAEDIIGIQGANIDYIRRTSGAILTIQESRGLPDEIIVEIKGTSSQVQTAQQLIQEFISSRRDPLPGSYNDLDSAYRPSYPQLGGSSYSSASSYPGQSYGDYGSSSVGGYSSYRL